jgi:hypothetical protein
MKKAADPIDASERMARNITVRLLKVVCGCSGGGCSSIGCKNRATSLLVSISNLRDAGS